MLYYALYTLFAPLEVGRARSDRNQPLYRIFGFIARLGMIPFKVISRKSARNRRAARDIGVTSGSNFVVRASRENDSRSSCILTFVIRKELSFQKIDANDL